MYKGRYFIRESIYICGNYMDADIYPVYQPAGKRRKKCKPTSEIQAKLNQKNAEKKITRLVHLNFTPKDVALHLTYDEHPENIEQAQKDLYNFLRRVKRRRVKLGLCELKYISSTEHGEKNGRTHHHLIMSGGIDRDELEQLWGKGFANSKRLQFNDEGVAGLAHYIVKDKQFFKRWNQSRNLKQPEPIVRDGVVTRDELDSMQAAIENKNPWTLFEERYPGFELTDASFTLNGINHGGYVHFEMRRRDCFGRKTGRPSGKGSGAGNGKVPATNDPGRGADSRGKIPKHRR